MGVILKVIISLPFPHTVHLSRMPFVCLSPEREFINHGYLLYQVLGLTSGRAAVEKNWHSPICHGVQGIV